MRLIDAHAHLLPAARLASLLRWANRFMTAHPYAERTALEALLDEYEQVGVDLIFNMIYPIFEGTTEELNRFNFELAQRYAPRILPVGSLHVNDDDKLGIVDACINTYQFLGLKFHPFIQRFDPWDERLFPVYERMSELRRPIFLHTGFEEFYQGSMPVEKLEREILHRFPELPIVFMHALFPCFEEAFRLLDRFPHLYLDIANVYGSLAQDPFKEAYGLPSIEAYRTDGIERVERIFLDGLNVWHQRIMFGSDHPAGLGSLQGIYDTARSLPISDEAKENILGGAALALVEKYYGTWPPEAYRA